MAFDHHIKADKVDDLGFFATFLRAPVVGSLMWFLGGEKAKEREKEELRKQMMQSDETCDDESNDSGSQSPLFAVPPREFSSSERLRKLGYGTKRMPPRLIGSDISEFADCVIPEEAMVSQNQHSCLTHSERSDDLRRVTRSSRSLSWSDDNGQELAEVIKEVSESKSRLGLVA